MLDAFFYALEKIGFYGGIAVFSTLLLLWTIYKVSMEKINNICVITNKLDETINIIRQAMVTKDGEVILLEEHQQLLKVILQKIFDVQRETVGLLKKHIIDVEKIADDEKFVTCDVNRCKHLPRVITLIEQTRESLKDFVEDEKEGRYAVKDSVQGISAKFDMFLVEVLRALQDEKRRLSE